MMCYSMVYDRTVEGGAVAGGLLVPPRCSSSASEDESAS